MKIKAVSAFKRKFVFVQALVLTFLLISLFILTSCSLTSWWDFEPEISSMRLDAWLYGDIIDISDEFFEDGWCIISYAAENYETDQNGDKIFNYRTVLYVGEVNNEAIPSEYLDSMNFLLRPMYAGRDLGLSWIPLTAYRDSRFPNRGFSSLVRVEDSQIGKHILTTSGRASINGRFNNYVIFSVVPDSLSGNFDSRKVSFELYYWDDDCYWNESGCFSRLGGTHRLKHGLWF